jgi:alpha-tubulin suppressor-like RCC1 family protein
MPNIKRGMMGAAGSGGAANGTIFSWGSGDKGRSDHGNTTNYSSPVQIGSDAEWNYSTTQYTGCAAGEKQGHALKAEGTVWGWGENERGELGTGSTTNDYSSPVQFGAESNWVKIHCQYAAFMAINDAGELWDCGLNLDGELGLGDVAPRSSPTQVGSLTTWDLARGGAHASLGLLTDGTMWSWGRNSVGQLGLGNTTSYCSPVQIGSLTTWRYISAAGPARDGGCFAVKTDGTLWTWGNNDTGQLGLGDTTDRCSPVQVGSLTDWRAASIGDFFTLFVKTDGTLWSTGKNTQGQLGIGDKTSRSSPVQIGSLTTWRAGGLSAGRSMGSAIKTDGTLWVWGTYNTQGGTGVSSGSTCSPVQVGSETDWANQALQFQATTAVRSP